MSPLLNGLKGCKSKAYWGVRSLICITMHVDAQLIHAKFTQEMPTNHSGFF
jgi:hypothetical protein